MVLLLDLDGTITNTVHPTWKTYKDGLQDYPVENIPFFPGVEEFIYFCQDYWEFKIYIISDSHPRWVKPIAEKLGLEALCLSDKPNTDKILQFLYEKRVSINEVEFFIGDSSLDIELGRKLGINTIWMCPYQLSDEIRNFRDGIDEMACIKTGPTYATKSYDDIVSILDNPTSHLYPIEGAFAGVNSYRPIIFSELHRADGTCSSIYCMGRQEQGLCDKHAVAIKYYDFQKQDRTHDLLKTIAVGVSNFLNQSCFAEQRWNIISYIPDKATTIPQNKLKELFEMVDTNIFKTELFGWGNLILGSLRERESYSARRAFLEDHLSVKEEMDLAGKNIIVLDDQLTTGATAWFVIDKLKKHGAANIMFVALFQMILNVSPNMICPQCGNQMLVKINRNNGKRFFSCLPPRFGGNGCGYIINID